MIGTKAQVFRAPDAAPAGDNSTGFEEQTDW